MGKERAKEIIESAETNMYKYKAIHDIDMWGMYKQKQVSILAFAVNNKVCSSLLSPFILGAEELKKSDSVSDNLDNSLFLPRAWIESCFQQM